MSALFNVPSAAVLLLSLALILRETGWRGARLFSVLGVLLILTYSLGRIGEGVDGLLGAVSALGATEAVRFALLVLGSGYLFGTVSDLCREAGESGLGEAVELAGRAELILLSLPKLGEILKIAAELVKNA